MNMLAGKDRPRRGQRVLLVESDRALGRVIARALERRHSVTLLSSVESALHALGQREDVDAVVSAYRLREGTTARRLLSSVRWRWPRPRLVLYAADTDLRADVRAMADVVVRLPGEFDELMRAVGD